MSFFLELHRLLEAGERVAMVTVIQNEGSSPRKVGARMLVRANGSIVGTIGGGTVEFEVIKQALAVLKGEDPKVYQVHLTRELGMCCGGAMSFFIEPLSQNPRLVLFGAGHVSHALAPIAEAAGFEVWVVDDRAEFANRERFPSAQLVLDDPLAALEELPPHAQSYYVIQTHLHRLDEELLRALVTKPHVYLGMIGSRAKIARFIERLRARGVAEEALARVTMPIGLDIGAMTPAEIAISIAAELVQVRRIGRRPGEGAGAMHWRPRKTLEKTAPSEGQEG